MKNIIFIILLYFVTFACTSLNKTEKVNLDIAKTAHTKFSDMKNDLSFEEYRSLIVSYGQNQKFPDINK